MRSHALTPRPSAGRLLMRRPAPKKWHEAVFDLSFLETKLRVQDLAPPVNPGHAGARGRYSIVIRSSEIGVPTKTQTFDDSVVIDRSDLAWMDSWWAVLRRGCPPEAPLFPNITQEQYSKDIKLALEKVGAAALHPTAYSMRHGGPSWDFMTKSRTLEEIQRRGRWRVAASVARYQKSAKMLQGMHKVAPAARSHAECVARRLRLNLAEAGRRLLSGSQQIGAGGNKASSSKSLQAPVEWRGWLLQGGLERSLPTSSLGRHMM